MSEKMYSIRHNINGLTVRELTDVKVEIDKIIRRLKEVEEKYDKIINGK